MARRTIGFIVTVIALIAVVHHIEYNPDLRERLLEDPWKSFGLLVLLALALVSLGWAVVRPSAFKTVLAFGLGIASALWTGDLLGGIDGGQIAVLFGGFIGLIVLWALTCGPDSWFKSISSRYQKTKTKLINKLPKPKSSSDGPTAVADPDEPAPARIVR